MEPTRTHPAEATDLEASWFFNSPHWKYTSASLRPFQNTIWNRTRDAAETDGDGIMGWSVTHVLRHVDADALLLPDEQNENTSVGFP